MQKLISLLIACLILIGFGGVSALAAPPENRPVVRAILFYSPTCGHCHYVISEVLAPMVDELGPQLHIIGLDVSTAAGGQLYQATIEHFNIPPDRRGVPTLILEDRVLVGSGEIPAQFPNLVAQYLAADGCLWPDIPGLSAAIAEAEVEAETETVSPATPVPDPIKSEVAEGSPAVAPKPAQPAAPAPVDTAPIYLAYFFDPTCLACTQVSGELQTLQEVHPHLVVRTFNVQEEAALNEALCQKYQVPPDHHMIAPAIFIGERALMPDDINAGTLATLVKNPDPAALVPPWQGLDDPALASARIVDRFRGFSLLAVAGAGLLDGVNPCAFTTIIFFVSYLALVGRAGRDILLVGAAFTLAVFLTYLLMGLGLAELIRQVEGLALVGQVIYAITALICLTLGAISLRDYFMIRRGRLNQISLQLPKALKQRIHHTIRTRSRMKGFVSAAFGAGVLVSIFELACTGQVYLPTIIFVTSIADLRLTAISYLILYNFMFVVPLVAVFTATYYGTTNQKLTSLFQQNAALVKLFTAALFVLLGLWLGVLVF